MRKIKEYWTPTLQDVKEFQEISNAENLEFEKLEQSIHDLVNDQFIQTATERGVTRREKILKIASLKGDSLEDRKFKISLKWNDRLPYTYRVLEDKLNQIFGDSYEMERIVNQHLLKIRIDTFNWGIFNSIIDEIRKMVPATMVLESTLNQQIKSNFYIATAMLSGEEITVYPYSTRNLESQGKIYIATGSNTGIEDVTVYPRKEVI